MNKNKSFNLFNYITMSETINLNILKSELKHNYENYDIFIKIIEKITVGTAEVLNDKIESAMKVYLELLGDGNYKNTLYIKYIF